MITGNTKLAKMIPDVVGNIGLSALQDDCTENSPIDDCHFLIVVTSKRLQPTGVPMVLPPGLSIVAKLQMPPSKSASLVSFVLPFPRASHGSGGRALLAGGGQSEDQVFAPGESIGRFCSFLSQCIFILSLLEWLQLCFENVRKHSRQN